jgi:hypothetical protein
MRDRYREPRWTAFLLLSGLGLRMAAGNRTPLTSAAWCGEARLEPVYGFLAVRRCGTLLLYDRSRRSNYVFDQWS